MPPMTHYTCGLHSVTKTISALCVLIQSNFHVTTALVAKLDFRRVYISVSLYITKLKDMIKGLWIFQRGPLKMTWMSLTELAKSHETKALPSNRCNLE